MQTLPIAPPAEMSLDTVELGIKIAVLVVLIVKSVNKSSLEVCSKVFNFQCR